MNKTLTVLAGICSIALWSSRLSAADIHPVVHQVQTPVAVASVRDTCVPAHVSPAPIVPTRHVAGSGRRKAARAVRAQKGR